MKAAKITTVVDPTEVMSPDLVPSAEFPPMPAAIASKPATLRRFLLLGVALATAWVAFTTISSIMEINATMDEINRNLAVPLLVNN
jgi:hypothetical protein